MLGWIIQNVDKLWPPVPLGNTEIVFHESLKVTLKAERINSQRPLPMILQRHKGSVSHPEVKRVFVHS